MDSKNHFMAVKGKGARFISSAGVVLLTILIKASFTFGQVSVPVSPFESTLKDFSVTVSEWSHDSEEVETPTALESEAFFQHSAKPIIRIEKSRVVFGIHGSHPVWIEVFLKMDGQTILASQNFQFDEKKNAIEQPSRVVNFLDPQQSDYRSITPFFGPYTPAASDFAKLLGMIAESGRLVEAADGGSILVGTVDGIGDFEVTYGEADKLYPIKFLRKLSQGDKLNSSSRLGFIDDQPSSSPRAIAKETDLWTNLRYEDRRDRQLLVYAEQQIASFRKDNSVNRFFRKVEFKYDSFEEPSDRLEWKNPFLKIRNGVPVEMVPVDHRRFELFEGRTVLVVDKKAIGAINSIELFEKPGTAVSWSGISFIVLVTLLVVSSAVYLFWHQGNSS